jgi:hypothetical protein
MHVELRNGSPGAGYQAEAQVLFKEAREAAPGFSRIKAPTTNRQQEDRSEYLPSRFGRAHISLQDILERTSGEDLPAADVIEGADTIYLVGQLRPAPVVELLRYMQPY